MLQLNEKYQTITELFSLTKSELNKKMIQETQMKAYKDYCKEQQCSKYSFLLRKFFLNQYITDKMCTELNRIYNDGFGIKSMAKAIGISYTNCRYLLGSSGIELRTGHGVVTDTLRLSRKNKAIEEKLNKTGWFREDVRAHLMTKSKTHRGVQGWYFNLSKQKWVWLRSTYEYIFAKWLDRTKHIWDCEVKCYDINGETYRPDFFIYDERENLIKIVEIKGYYDNRSYKADLLNQLLEIDVCLIGVNNHTIQTYIDTGSNYSKELKQWKIKRTQNENTKNNN